MVVVVVVDTTTGVAVTAIVEVAAVIEVVTIVAAVIMIVAAVVPGMDTALHGTIDEVAVVEEATGHRVTVIVVTIDVNKSK